MKFSCLFYITVLWLLIASAAGCSRETTKIKFEYGTFPDTIIPLEGLNTVYNDYNIAFDPLVPGTITSSVPVVFASDRNSQGSDFDLVYGFIGYTFNRITGEFSVSAASEEDPFLKSLVNAMNTSGNDYGPNRVYCSEDGYEYAFVASEVPGRGLDLRYTRYIPVYSASTSVPGPVPAAIFNSTSDDAYVTFNSRLDTAYFCSDREGNFNIYSVKRNREESFNTWLLSSQNQPQPVDSIRSAANEKCPCVSGKVMVFASDREGGYGGWDLYFSVFRSGKWSSPVNMGKKVNTQYNEYRPVIFTNNSYTNRFMVFSSDRPGGKGGYDLYFTWFNIK